MIKEIEANYEGGIMRPVEMLEPPEGSRPNVILMTNDDPRPNCDAAEMLAEIAALPLECASNSFSGREHDSILYPTKPIT